MLELVLVPVVEGLNITGSGVVAVSIFAYRSLFSYSSSDFRSGQADMLVYS